MNGESSITDNLVAQLQQDLGQASGTPPAEPPAAAAKPDTKPAAPATTTPQEYEIDGAKYTPDQIKEALKTHKDIHTFRSNLTSEKKELASITRAIDPVFSLVDAMAKNPEAAKDLRNQIEAQLGEEAAKSFDATIALKRAELKDPREAEFQQRQIELDQRQFDMDYAEEKKSLMRARGTEGEEGYMPGLTEDEIAKVEDFADETLKKDREINPKAAALTLERAYLLSPLYQQKLRESADAYVKAEKDKAKGQPGGKAAGAPAPRRKPGEPMKASDISDEDMQSIRESVG